MRYLKNVFCVIVLKLKWLIIICFIFGVEKYELFKSIIKIYYLNAALNYIKLKFESMCTM